MDERIETFVAQLACAQMAGPVFNPYDNQVGDQRLGRANSLRRDNLRLYLGLMAAARPALLLVGEAPGYRGCRLTGVPFTSEAILMDERIWPFGAQAGFRAAAEHLSPVKEATATMVWSALDGRPPALLWNAFPFHPHRPGQPATNRRPTSQEMLLGGPFLGTLIELFQPHAVGAVGRCAAAALHRLGLANFCPLRHPSHGGKSAFMAGLEQLYARQIMG